MIIDYMVGFVQFLNKNQYCISNDKLSRFFSLIYSLGISFSNERELLGLMKTVFCSNPVQVQYLPAYFEEYTSMYMKELKTEKKKDKLQEEKEQHEKNYREKLSSKEDLLSMLDKELEENLEKIKNEEINFDKNMSSKDRKFLNKNLEVLKNVNLDNQTLESFLNEFEKEQTFENVVDTFEKTANFLVQKSEELLFGGKIEEFEIEQEFYQILKRVSTKVKKSELTTKIEREKNKTEQKKRKIENEIEKERLEHERVMQELRDIIREINKKPESKIVQKEIATVHREQFQGKYAVQTKYTDAIFTKNFDKLNTEEKKQILRYLKRNLLKFKTKMTRSIHSNEKLNLDMQTTIQHACKTGGLPMELVFQKPMKNKTNLVLILDVSGSCSDASQMMLTFMYLLKDVFPRGCDAFAFVDTLYDISDIMASNDIETSVNKVLNVIPRKGVYSNYYKPMKSLWKDYRKKITKDSIVIFMGDARNNKNQTAEEFMKNIGHRAKKCIWLNTEPMNKWDKADSIASVYGKYAKMYEVVNTGELIHFIDTF